MIPPTLPQHRSRRRRLSLGASGPPPCPHAHTHIHTHTHSHSTFALSAPAPGLRPARGGAAAAAGLGRACAAGPGPWPRTVCAAVAAAWGRRWSLPPAPQVGAAGGRVNEREGGKGGGKKGGRRGGGASPRHTHFTPAFLSPTAARLAEASVGNPRRFPLAPHTRRRGRWPGLRRTAGGCWQGPPWGAPARPPRGSRRTGTSPPPSAGSRPPPPSFPPSLLAAAAVGSGGSMRGEGSCGVSRHPRVPAVASDCVAKVKHQLCGPRLRAAELLS